MTFNPVAALNVLECTDFISDQSPTAIDLGSQTSSINSVFVSNLIQQKTSLKKIQKKNLEKLSNKTNFSTEEYFKSIGFKTINRLI